jgi:hypothetical protein
MSSSLDLEDEPVAAGCANATTIGADDFPSGLPHAVSKKASFESLRSRSQL